MHFNKAELKNAMLVSFEKMADVISIFDRIDTIESKIATVEEYGLSVKDIDNDVTLDSLKERRERLLYSLMYGMFAANREYHEKTGKYLMGKKEKNLQTAEEIFEALLKVI